MAQPIRLPLATSLRFAGVALLVALAAACGSKSANQTASSPTPQPEASAPATPTPAPPPRWDATIGFHTHAQLLEHYAKHGREFGAASAEDYLHMAQALRDAPAGGNVLELERPDGTLCRFDKSTGAFIAIDPDGTIRTFFKPNDGLRYFERQAERPHRAS